MSLSVSIGGDVESLGVAIGILKPASGGSSLDPDFFKSPWSRVSRILSNEPQRAALVTALQSMLPSAAAGSAALPSGVLRDRFPLLEVGSPGQIYLVLERATPAAGAPLTLSVQAEAAAANDGPLVLAELVLLTATGSTIAPAFATRDHPLRIEASAPVDANGARLALTLKVVAPPDENLSRLVVSLSGLPEGQVPVEFDLAPGEQPEISRIVSALIQIALAAAGPSVPAEVKRVAESLPGLLGLIAGLPPLPIGDLVSDPSAFRAWLASLAGATADDGRPGLVAWMSSLGRLIGAPALVSPWPEATEIDPVVLELLTSSGAGSPALALTAGLRIDPSHGASVLVITLRAGLSGTTIDAMLLGEVLLFAIPLTGAGRTALLERVELRIDAPASGAPLLAPGGPVDVGGLRAGLRAEFTSGAVRVVPMLEVLDVNITTASSTHFDRLDLTSASTLTSAAESVLDQAIRDGLGAAGPIVDALRTLLGLRLAGSPALDVAKFAGAPTRAIAEYYRALRAEAGGWTPVIEALAKLMGASAPAASGTGIGDDPWYVALDALVIPNSPVAVGLAIWDVGDASTPKLRLALQVRAADAAGAAWRVVASVAILAVDLPVGGGGNVRWLGEVRADVWLVPPPLPAVAGLAVSATDLHVAAAWSPGTPFGVTASIDGLAISANDETVTLGDLVFPPAASFDVNLPDLGTGLDPDALWQATRLLLARTLGSWSGPATRGLLSLAGISAPGTAGLADDLPPLELPVAGDLGSLLRDPASAIRRWLVTIFADAAMSVAADGSAYLPQLLRVAQAILTESEWSSGPDLAEPDLPVYGAGTPERPFAAPLHSAGRPPLELLVWMEPSGPPDSWSGSVMETLFASERTASDIVSAALRIGDLAPGIAATVQHRDPMRLALRLQKLASALGNSDGLLSGASPDVLPDGWTAGETVAAVHHQLPGHPDAVGQVRQFVQDCTVDVAAEPWSVLLLAPPLAGARCWEPLLDGVATAERATVSLRAAQTSPAQVDLGGIAAARWYEVDLADDGDATLAEVVARLGRVVSAVRQRQSNARVVLVAHSYLAPVAQAYVTATPTAVLGLATLASPIGTGGAFSLTDPDLAEAVRAAAGLGPFGIPGDAGAAVSLLARLLDGYAEPVAGKPPAAAPFPSAAFARAAASPDLYGVPALAVAGSVTDALTDSLVSALGFALQVGSNYSAPSAMVWGVRAGLELPAAVASDPDVDVSLRLGLGTLTAAPGTQNGAREPLEVRATIARKDGWLLGGPGDGQPMASRVRWMELVGQLVPTDAGGTAVFFDIRLHDVGLRGATASEVALRDAGAADLIDAVIAKLDASAAPSGRLQALLAFLVSIGLVRRSSSAAPAALLTDGLSALELDGVNLLAGKLAPMLDSASGLFGLTRAAGVAAGAGPWRLPLTPVAAEVVVEKAPWRVTVQTTGAGLPVAPGTTVQGSGMVRLADLSADVTGGATVGGTTVGRATPGGPVVLASAFVNAPLTLMPGDPAVIGPALVSALPRLLIGGTLTALIEQYVGGGYVSAPIGEILRDPSGWFASAGGFGDGTLPTAGGINTLLSVVAKLAGLQGPAGTPIVLPGGFALKAVDVGVGSARTLEFTLSTGGGLVLDAASGVTLALQLELALDRQRHVAPGGQLTLHVPLPGGAASGFGAIDITAGADPAGLQLAIASTSGVAITLLPTVTGLDTLVSAGVRQLLPEVLDQVAVRLAALPAPPAALPDVLAVAGALGIYDPSAAAGTGFKQKSAQLAALEQALAAGNFQALAPGIATAIGTVLTRVLGPGVLAPNLSAGRIGVRISNVLGGHVDLIADLSTPVPGLEVVAQSITAGAVALGVDATFINGALALTIDVTATIDTGAGLVLTPRIVAGLDTAGGVHLTLALQPLGDTSVVIPLAPVPAPPTVADLLALAEAWLLPLGGTLLLRAADSAGVLALPLWPGAGKTIGDLVVASGVATDGTGSYAIRMPLVAPPMMLKGLLDGLVGAPIPFPGGFSLTVITDGHAYGLALGGEQIIQAGDYAVALRLGVPVVVDPGWGSMGKGIGLLILDLTTPTSPVIAPVLRLGGLGVRVGRKDPALPLVNAGGFRLGGAAAYVSTDIALSGAGAPKIVGDVYGAVELDGLGLLIGSGGNGANPVAGSLLEGGKGGDQTPANPPFDLLVGKGPAGWRVRFAGEAKLRIEVKKTFGPLHIEEIDIIYVAEQTGSGRVGMGIGGGISLAGLAVSVKELQVLVPIDHPSDTSKWTFDLQGLAVSLDTASVKIAGGLLKATLPDGTIDYEGMLSVQVAGRGLTAIGAYARPTDALGGYTSLFLFVAVRVPLGGPPFFFVTGLAGGAGFNRRLLVPRDPAAIPTFPLVAAMTGGGSPDPMVQLATISMDIPPSRGSFWLAAGIQFTTFEIVHTTALLAVAMDRGLEVSLLGLMQLALPDAEAAIVSLELALVAKYSTVDQILSVRAGLTGNSWLISRDCRLTGGFALMVWFARPEVMLTVGGYSLKFEKPDYYPDVPRVGFHWDVTKGIVVKGESFFAITHAAVMVGGALEISYDVDPVRVWFSADIDAIMFWDPFHYVVDASVSIGASFHFEVCFIACATISVSVSLGAWLHIEGPPLYAKVRVDLAITSVTVEFGGMTPQEFLTWDQVWPKYLSDGDTTKPATAGMIAAGTVPGAVTGNGSLDAPWTVAPEATVRVETKMPASRWRLGATAAYTNAAGAPSFVDVVPADTAVVGQVRGDLTLSLERSQGTGWVALTPAQLAALQPTEVTGHFPGAIWDAASLANPSAPKAMLSALGAMELATSVRTSEVTGALLDVPFSSMVEEETALRLDFGTAAAATPTARVVAAGKAGRAAAARAVAARASDATPLSAADAPAPRSPTLRAAVPHGRLHARAFLAATRRSAAGRSGARLGGEALPIGGAHFWDIEPTRSHELTLTGTGRRIRVVALGGTGGVLTDERVKRGRSVTPVGTTSVVVSEMPVTDAPGWELATPLLHVAPATLLAPGATVHLPRPWAAERLPGTPSGPAWVSAAMVTAELDRILTRFVLGDSAAPSVIVVRLDSRGTRGEPTDVIVDVEGADLGEARVVRSGTRVDLVHTVRRLKRGADAIGVRVTTGARWRLVGVVGETGTARHWTAALGRDPHARLQQIAPPDVTRAPSTVVVRPTRVRNKR